MGGELQRIQGGAAAVSGERSVEEVVAHVRLVGQVMQAVMRAGEHYMVIPGTGGSAERPPKPSLLKSGAEKLLLTFRLAPRFEIQTIPLAGGHREIIATCYLSHGPTGLEVGSALGSCSTAESKYAWRTAKRKCPACGAEAIIKGREEYGGGWVCFKKQGGCGAKYAAGAGEIEGQVVGRVANQDLADVYNTVLKMAEKRALVAAVLNVTAASDLFTQDVEDFREPERPADDRTGGLQVQEPQDASPPPQDASPPPQDPALVPRGTRKGQRWDSITDVAWLRTVWEHDLSTNAEVDAAALRLEDLGYARNEEGEWVSTAPPTLPERVAEPEPDDPVDLDSTIGGSGPLSKTTWRDAALRHPETLAANAKHFRSAVKRDAARAALDEALHGATGEKMVARVQLALAILGNEAAPDSTVPWARSPAGADVVRQLVGLVVGKPDGTLAAKVRQHIVYGLPPEATDTEALMQITLDQARQLIPLIQF